MSRLLERARVCLADGLTLVDKQDLADIARSLANMCACDALSRSVWECVQA
jgi:translation initiation factor 1 (eIF-1/SUI1)